MTYVNVFILFDIKIMIFRLKFAINTFYNLYYDYLGIFTNFWPGFSKWNTPFYLEMEETIYKKSA